MVAKKQKSFFKKIPNEIYAILIAFGIGLLLNYFNASIHVWGTVLGIWMLMVLYEIVDLKNQIKQK